MITGLLFVLSMVASGIAWAIVEIRRDSGEPIGYEVAALCVAAFFMLLLTVHLMWEVL